MHICCINDKLDQTLDVFSKQHYIYFQRIHTYCIKHNLTCFIPSFIPYDRTNFIKSFIGVLNKANTGKKITLVLPKEDDIKYFNQSLSLNDNDSILSTNSFDCNYLIPEILDQFNVNSKIIAKNEELYQSIKLFERKLISNFKSRGHAKAHFILSKYVKCDKKIIYDIGCAPGYVSYIKSKEIYGAHYVGEGAVSLKFRNRYKEIIEFTDLDQLKLIPKCNIVYSDIGNEDHSFHDYHKLLRISENAEYLIFKSFIDHYDHFIKLLHNFENVSIIKPSYSFSINKEIYCICSGLLKQPIVRDFTGQINMILHSLVTTQINYMKKSVPEIHPQLIDDEEIKQLISVEKQLMEQEAMVYNLESQDKSNRFHELAVEAMNKINTIDKSDVKFDIKLYNAVGGSAKSVIIKTKANKTSDVIFVPTNELVSNYKKCGFKKVFTRHTIWLCKEIKVLWIDECFTISKGLLGLLKKYFNPIAINLYGCSDQISLVDFNNIYSEEQNLIKLVKKCNNNRTFRSPLDVCDSINNCPMASENKKIYSITTRPYSEFAATRKYFPNIKIETLTQRNKEIISDNANRCNTIHETQGGEYDHLIWVIDLKDISFLNDHKEHIVTALSRHNNTLLIFGLVNNIPEITLNYYNSTFEISAELAERPIFSTTVFNHEPDLTTKPAILQD